MVTWGTKYGLIKAGIKERECISGLTKLMIVKTADKTAVKANNQEYFQRLKASNPAADRKNEYQRRVSPMVRMGGLSSLSHRPIIKAKIMTAPVNTK
jgi:hypothetical protein